MEIIKNYFIFNKKSSPDIVYLCTTKQKADKFLNKCKSQFGTRELLGGDDALTAWDEFKNKTCYKIIAGAGVVCLVYADFKTYKSNGAEVVKWNY